MAILTIGLATGCLGLQTGNTLAPQAEFSRYGTFTVSSSASSQSGVARLDDPILQLRIQQEIARAMIAKGYILVPSGPCDLTLHYSISLQRRLEAEATPLGTNSNSSKGWGREAFSGKAMGKRDTYVREIDRGTLVIEVVDNVGGGTVWRGYGQADLQRRASDAQRTRRLRAAITSVLGPIPKRRG